jgi:beta-mannosidase
VLWDGCNECNGHGIYADFVMTTVAAEDTSRPPWPSCPANGWSSGVDALWGLPNGSPLGLQPRITSGEGAAARTPTHLTMPIAGTCAIQTSGGAAALGCAAGGSNCSYVPNQDYDQGTIGPNAGSSSAADCCAKCAARSDCWAATYVPGTCWFKTKDQTSRPGYNGNAVGCWPAGRTPPPPSPPGCASLPYETHGYYQHGEGYSTVNSNGRLSPFDPNQPPAMPQAALTGPACPGTYASEFGAVAISSWESMMPTLAPTSWGLHNAAMAQRNYAVDNFITAFANSPWPGSFDNVTGQATFQKQLYWQMLAQALWIKSDIEGRRAQNAWGTVTWQVRTAPPFTLPLFCRFLPPPPLLYTLTPRARHSATSPPRPSPPSFAFPFPLPIKVQ